MQNDEEKQLSRAEAESSGKSMEEELEVSRL
jgi:hypothetical protein